jgi:hypothetical protein
MADKEPRQPTHRAYSVIMEAVAELTVTRYWETRTL